LAGEWPDSEWPSAPRCVYDDTVGVNYHYDLRAEATKVDDSYPERTREMKCSIVGCPGEYEERQIVHTVHQRGQILVINHVPAEVCSVCGDVLLKPETVRHIEELLRVPTRPVGAVPLYEYA